MQTNLKKKKTVCQPASLTTPPCAWLIAVSSPFFGGGPAGPAWFYRPKVGWAKTS